MEAVRSVKIIEVLVFLLGAYLDKYRKSMLGDGSRQNI